MIDAYVVLTGVLLQDLKGTVMETFKLPGVLLRDVAINGTWLLAIGSLEHQADGDRPRNSASPLEKQIICQSLSHRHSISSLNSPV